MLTASDGEEGIEKIKNNVIDLVLTDYRMPKKNGLEVLKETKQINPNIDVVVITAFGNLDDAVGIMKNGAYDYLTKPIDLDELGVGRLVDLLDGLNRSDGTDTMKRILDEFGRQTGGGSP